MTSSHDAPPRDLTSPLEVDPSDWERRQVYFLLSGLVVPRPIAWVSTVDEAGVRNVAPHSFFNIVAIDPPHVAFSTGGVNDTLSNIRASGEFVVNVASTDLVEEMNATSTDLPPEFDEFSWVGLETSESVRVAAPRVARAHAHLECRLAHELPIGSHNLVVGEVIHIHVDPGVWRDGRVDAQLLDPVLRLGGTGYATLGEIFKLPRPSFDDVASAEVADRIPRREA